MEDFEGTQEVERLVQGGNTVVIGMHSVGRARRSRIPADVRWAALAEVRDGRISRVDVYGERSKALKAVGLKELAACSGMAPGPLAPDPWRQRTSTHPRARLSANERPRRHD